ncbi:MAG: substrate-binding domain-containing protein [candidate division Zixibacteria bacterium]|nr:substrate-binding domain-containing protein [candidate division Zixibacteria bacterium]
MRGLRVWTAILLIAYLGTMISGCGNADDKAKTRTDGQQISGVTIGVSLLTRTHPFYQDLEEGLKAAATEAGFELLVTAGEFDVARQKDQIQDFIVQKVNAIVVSPCDSKSIGTAIQAANEVGIPVFTADIACLAEGAKVVTHVASDNVGGGRLAARAVAAAINNSGKVAIIDHPEVESVIQRVRGFEEEIANFPGITVVAKLSGHGVKDQAFRTAEDILQAQPDVTAIFGINDDSALGALAAIEKAGKTGKVKIVGFDAVPEARQAIRDGKIYADVIQQPKEIGQQTVEAVKTYLSGGAVSPTVLIPCDLFTQADAN